MFNWEFESPDSKHPEDQMAKLESDTTGLSGAIVKVGKINVDPLTRSVLVHLWVKSVSDAIAQAKMVGGATVQEEEQSPGFRAKIRDSEGNIVGLFSLTA